METAIDCLVRWIPELDIGGDANGDLRAAGIGPFVAVEEFIDERITVHAAIAGASGGITICVNVIDDTRGDGFTVIFCGRKPAFALSEKGQVAIDVRGDLVDIFLLDEIGEVFRGLPCVFVVEAVGDEWAIRDFFR